MTDSVSPPDTRPCPFCGAPIDAPANLCSKCGRFSSPAKIGKTGRDNLQNLKNILENRQDEQDIIESKIEEILDRIEVWIRKLPSWLPLAIALSAFGLAILLVAVGGWYDLRGAMAFIVLGFTILLRKKLIKPASERQRVDEKSDVAIRWMGFDTNLVVVQILTLVAMFWYAYRWETGLASIFAIACIVLAFVIHKTSYRIVAILSAISALGFFAILWLYPSAFTGSLKEQMEWRLSYLYNPLIPWETIVITIGFIASVPQIQILRIGNFGVGNLKWDFEVKSFGSIVPICILSSIIFVSLIYSIEQIFRLSRFIILHI